MTFSLHPPPNFKHYICDYIWLYTYLIILPYTKCQIPNRWQQHLNNSFHSLHSINFRGSREDPPLNQIIYVRRLPYVNMDFDATVT